MPLSVRVITLNLLLGRLIDRQEKRRGEASPTAAVCPTFVHCDCDCTPAQLRCAAQRRKNGRRSSIGANYHSAALARRADRPASEFPGRHLARKKESSLPLRLTGRLSNLGIGRRADRGFLLSLSFPRRSTPFLLNDYYFSSVN